MNKTGSTASIGAILLLFIGVIVAIPLLQSSAQQVGNVVNTEHYTNQSVVIPAALNTNVLLSGQAVSNVVLYNSTGSVITSGNYTTTNYNVVNGALVSYVKFTASGFNGTTIKANYDSEPYGYATDSSTRSVASLITILGALAIAAFVIGKTLEDGLDAFKID